MIRRVRVSVFLGFAVVGACAPAARNELLAPPQAGSAIVAGAAPEVAPPQPRPSASAALPPVCAGKIVQLAHGDGRVCGVTIDGEVVTLHHGRPRDCVAGLHGAKRVACYLDATCAETASGVWQCLGDVGLARREFDDEPAEIPIVDVADVTLGRAHSCAITHHGDVYCWGGNARHESGVAGSTERVTTPVKLASQIDEVAVGEDSTWLLRRDGAVLVVGRVFFRAQGVRTTEPSARPGFAECAGGCFAPRPVIAPFPGAVAKLVGEGCAILRSGASGCLDYGLPEAPPSGAGVCDTAWCGGAEDTSCRIESGVGICGSTRVDVDR